MQILQHPQSLEGGQHVPPLGRPGQHTTPHTDTESGQLSLPAPTTGMSINLIFIFIPNILPLTGFAPIKYSLF